MDTKDLDNQQKFWEANQATYHSVFNAKLLIFLVKPYIGERILDAGAGDGALMNALAKLPASRTILGADIAPKTPGILKNDLKSLSFKDNAFDTLFCVEVIEHLSPEDTGQVMPEIRRVLKPGGAFIMTTPFAENLAEHQVTCPRCNLTFHRVLHQQSFREHDFEQLATANGFKPLMILPVKYSRVRRFQFLGRRFFTNSWWGHRISGSKGKHNLIMVARNQKQA
jgi:ubiquinone/menaquinone biosynthesis C-methylase UbiE